MDWADLVLSRAPDGALVGLVVIAIVAVWKGWLVPRATVDQLEEATERIEGIQAERLADSLRRESEWKAAWMAEKARSDLQADQLGDLLELARTTDAFIRGVHRVAGGGAQ